MGCLGMIDNDLMGMDYIIGFLIVVEMVVEVVDKFCDMVVSYEWMFVVEVMGCYSGYIVVYMVLVIGVEVVVILEMVIDIEVIVVYFSEFKEVGWDLIIMIVVEGDEKGGVDLIEW